MADIISYLLIGGYAASHAAIAIRKRDQTGTVVLLTAEEFLPYERPPLSKDMLFDDGFKPEDTQVKAQQFYDDHAITVRTRARVVSIDRALRTVSLENGETLHYAKLLLAPGAKAKAPEFPGSDFSNVYTLRKLPDSLKIREALNQHQKVVVLGGSYLGMETASGALKKGLDVTVVHSHSGPWHKFASPQLQQFLVDEYQKRGAKFYFNERVEKISGEGRAQFVHVKEGQVPCDFVIAATGSKLNLKLPQEAGLKVDEKLGTVVDEFYQTSDENIWAAGDCLNYPDPVVGKMWHNEHFMNAGWSGGIAGANMAGAQEKLEHAPYFFSDFLDLHMVLRGSPGAGKSQRVIGDMASGEFVELYGDEDGVLKMAVGMTHNKEKSDVLAEKLEPLVKSRTLISGVNASEIDI